MESKTVNLSGHAGKVAKFVLSPGSPFTLTPDMAVLHSEIVMNGDDEELLELWILVNSDYEEGKPVVTRDKGKDGDTIYFSQTVLEDDPDEEELMNDDGEFYYD